jgi:hypothetical protein
MPSQRHYVCAWTDNDIFSHCEHQHQTLASAVACTASACAGAYVVAVENGVYRELDPGEEALFRNLMYENPQRLERIVHWFGRMHLMLS